MMKRDAGQLFASILGHKFFSSEKHARLEMLDKGLVAVAL